MIDGTDRTIIEMLQATGRVSNADIARAVGMAPSAVLERIRKLEERGLIRGYHAEVDPRQLGLKLVAFVAVQANERAGAVETGAALAAMPEVQEVHHVAGEDCYLIKVRAADPADLGRVLRERIGAIPTVRSTRSTVVLETVKETGMVPVPPAEDGA